MLEQRQPLRLFTLWWLIGAAMWVFIIYSSLSPHPVIVPGRFSDKVLHFSGYFGVTAWFAQLYLRASIRQRQLYIFAMMGVLLEFAQLLVNERSFEWADMLANGSGVLVAGLLMRGRLETLLLYLEGIILRSHGR
ncbi:VanZ family protein [Sulfuriflexus mobilis]|uniref:VanZ family protein n=1 Tax=Sulfuriflexus mobilis TaxID=1811807 RepID=UPI000F83D0B0|nr:VanZ family protein [Sulfuriflexus mobilis]